MNTTNDYIYYCGLVEYHYWLLYMDRLHVLNKEHKEWIYHPRKSNFFEITIGHKGSLYKCRYNFNKGYRYSVYYGTKLLFVTNNFKDVIKNYRP